MQAYTDGQLHRIIAHGISPSGMPASKDIFADEEIWQVADVEHQLPARGAWESLKSMGAPAAQTRTPVTKKAYIQQV